MFSSSSIVRHSSTAPARLQSSAAFSTYDRGTLFEPPHWIWTRPREVGWWVKTEWRSILLGPDGLRLEEWRRAGLLSTVKRGPYRAVYRVDLPAGTIYIKHFLVPNLQTKLRQWFRRGKGRNEARRAIELARLGVPTIVPLALGEQRYRTFLLENYLITAGIPGSVPLDHFIEHDLPLLPEPLRSRVRRRLAVDLAVLTARIHGLGFIHLDFHPGNVLVQFEPDGRLLLNLIDLDALRSRPALTWRHRARNLALLNHYFWVRSARSDRHRFLRAYLDAWNGAHPGPVRVASAIEELTRSWAERLWRRWSRRCHRSNKYFKTFSKGDVWGVASRRLDRNAMRALVAHPDRPLASAGCHLLKHSRTTTVGEHVLPIDGQPTPVIYKRFHAKKWLDPILTLFRPSRGWHSWQAGQHLAIRDVPTPLNVAFLSRRWPRWLPPWLRFLPAETYVVTVKQPGVTTLADYVQEVLPGLEPAARRERIDRALAALAALIRKLHGQSLSHRDLKAANILIADADTVTATGGATPRLCLIDLVGVTLQHPLPRDRRIQNLARLQISLAEVPGRTRTDSLRFLRLYCPRIARDKVQWKALWRAVARRIEVKRAQNQHRHRPIS